MTTGLTIQERGKLMANPAALQVHIRKALQSGLRAHGAGNHGHCRGNGLSVVLFLLGVSERVPKGSQEPCLILNKRSARVPQPGDLCCPGGGIEPRVDRIAAHLLRLPLPTLKQWPQYRSWRAEAPRRAARLRLLMAAALREGLEEMRLNPLRVRFLGVLPPEHLVMFNRTIVPLVAWVHRQNHFHLNWEVERIVRIPLSALLTPKGYITLRLQMGERDAGRKSISGRDFPAFRFFSQKGTEVLWGATYRMTIHFLQQVFGFDPPELTGGTTVEKQLTADYLTGKG
jgi:hypothetical protein